MHVACLTDLKYSENFAQYIRKGLSDINMHILVCVFKYPYIPKRYSFQSL